jgi:hypothetical protein
MGDRCTQVPVTKSWEELAEETGADTALARQLDEIPAGVRASMDGEASGTLTYEDWLAGQSQARQQDILGPGRYELWTKGKLTLAEMLDQRGNPMTLEQLRARL